MLQLHKSRGRQMAFATTILMRMFGRPTGRLGRLGGRLMARMNARWGAWICDQLRINRSERALEVGFGPGSIIEHLSKLAPEGHVSGVDASPEMVAQARARNAAAIRSGHVD
jgi:SAM-dependent methyltransferase